MDKTVELLFFKYENIQTESTCTEISVEFRILFNNNHSKLQFHVNCFTFKKIIDENGAVMYII